MSRIYAISKGLDQGDVYIEPELSNVAATYLQNMDGFIMRQLFPSCPVATQGGKYRRFSKADFNRDEMALRADGAQSVVAQFREDTAQYYADVWSLATDVGPQMRANNPKADQNATKFLSRKALIKAEVEGATAFWGTSKWTTEYTGADNTPDSAQEVLPWTDEDADPIEQIEIAMAAYNLVSGGFPLNVAGFSEDLWVVFKNHPNVISRFSGGQTVGGAKVTRERVAELLEIPKILVGRAVKTTTGAGVVEASSAYGRILSTGLLMVHAAPAPSMDDPSAGYHFDWTGYTGATSVGAAVFEEEVPLTHGARRYTIEHASDAHKVSADLGVWFEALLTAAA